MLSKKIILSVLLYPAILVQALQAQTISVKGKISDTKGNAIISASIKVKDSKQGASSDTLGIFSIKVKANAELIFSAIGFADTTVSVNGRGHLTVILLPQTKALKEVVVSGSNQNADISSPEETSREQIIASTFETYLRASMFSSGILVVTGSGGLTSRIFGFGSLNTINSGEMLPMLEHKEDTRGSRYLLNRFAGGLVIDQNNNMINDSTMLLNYDKVDGQLIIAKDAKNYLTVDKDKVLAFAFKTPDTSYIFLNVPILSKTDYFLLISNGPKYSAYKSISTKFTKSHYMSNGLVESGNNYDEYVDKQTYYWVDQRNNTKGTFELKKKSIRDVFASEKEKTETYFAKHKTDGIDDNFIRNLIIYLNQ